MGLPTHHHSSSRRDRRRAHHALKQTNISVCLKCKAPILGHTACRNCGNYNGRNVLVVKVKKEKKK
ncbi:50S ribosomal protein L32 [Candidatus Azambacteria bacterium RIFCSPLOWO2_01_FULL_37_9]|uniref:Large ribosomal subunit protein bL32 n=1 Tax=Candidatus Azambacteria bacterium RIFCSPLOWO2_01_FULL_37_9 TaxID=1797297 RepID=A0A1F5C5L9_9BACT|nr:MAG: 50S ribosomal protein L32 [Candidatus Azambacteria bacterium RIFCSPLOWO2_01_FULL_37_9]